MANAVHIRDPFRPQLNPIHHAIAEPTRIDRQRLAIYRWAKSDKIHIRGFGSQL